MRREAAATAEERRRQAILADARRHAEAIEARRQAELAEARRESELVEAKRQVEEIDAQRQAEVAAARKQAQAAEARRLAEVAEVSRQAEEAEARRLAEVAEAKRQADAAEARRRAEVAEAKRQVEAAEVRRLEEAEAAAEALRLQAEEAAEEQRRVAEEAEEIRLADLAEARRQAEAAEARRRAEMEEAKKQAEVAAARREAEMAVVLERQFSQVEARIDALQEGLEENQIEPVREDLLEIVKDMSELSRGGRATSDALNAVSARLDEMEVKLTAARNMAGNRLGDIQDSLSGLVERIDGIEVEIPGFDAVRENQGAILERFDRMEGLVNRLASAEELLERVDGSEAPGADGRLAARGRERRRAPSEARRARRCAAGRAQRRGIAFPHRGASRRPRDRPDRGAAAAQDRRDCA